MTCHLSLGAPLGPQTQWFLNKSSTEKTHHFIPYASLQTVILPGHPLSLAHDLLSQRQSETPSAPSLIPSLKPARHPSSPHPWGLGGRCPPNLEMGLTLLKSQGRGLPGLFLALAIFSLKPARLL